MALLLASCLLLPGCGALLERSYSSIEPHSATYRVGDDEDTMRAESYQELVNALLLLVDAHAAEGVVRFYSDGTKTAELAARACTEVQRQTPLGAYLLDYITYAGEAESSYYELTVRFGYRRTEEEQKAIVNATSTEALPDLLRAAVMEQRDSVAIRVAYFSTDRDGVRETVRSVYEEFYPPEEAPEPVDPGETETAGTPSDAALPENAEKPDESVPPMEQTDGPDAPPEQPEMSWQICFYPEEDAHPGIIEVLLAPPEPSGPNENA